MSGATARSSRARPRLQAMVRSSGDWRPGFRAITSSPRSAWMGGTFWKCRDDLGHSRAAGGGVGLRQVEKFLAEEWGHRICVLRIFALVWAAACKRRTRVEPAASGCGLCHRQLLSAFLVTRALLKQAPLVRICPLIGSARTLCTIARSGEADRRSWLLFVGLQQRSRSRSSLDSGRCGYLGRLLFQPLQFCRGGRGRRFANHHALCRVSPASLGMLNPGCWASLRRTGRGHNGEDES
jgi:hypothetical protein